MHIYIANKQSINKNHKQKVHTDDDIRLIRRLQRDTLERARTVASVIEQYVNICYV